MEIKDKHEIIWDKDDGSETTEQAAVFYITETEVTLISKYLRMGLETPKAKFQKDYQTALKFHQQFSKSFKK